MPSETHVHIEKRTRLSLTVETNVNIQEGTCASATADVHIDETGVRLDLQQH